MAVIHARIGFAKGTPESGGSNIRDKVLLTVAQAKAEGDVIALGWDAEWAAATFEIDVPTVQRAQVTAGHVCASLLREGWAVFPMGSTIVLREVPVAFARHGAGIAYVGIVSPVGQS